MSERLRRYVKPIAFVAFIGLILVAAHVFGWGDMLLGRGGIDGLRELVGTRPVEAGLLYFAISIVGCVALALPGFLFAVAAGSIFGPVWGTLLCWVSMTAGACLSFLVGRFFLKDSLKPWLAKYPALDRLLFSGIDRSYTYLLAVTRLVPVFPFNVQNFAYGVTDVGFVPYAVLSAAFMLPGVAVYTVGSAGVFDAENRVALFAMAGALLAGSLVVAHVLKRKADLS